LAAFIEQIWQSAKNNCEWIEINTRYFVNNSVPGQGTPKRLPDYDSLAAEIGGIFNGLWNIFSIPLDTEGLRAKAAWPR